MKIITLLTALFFATSAFALDLETAKQTGQVGEKPDGYIGAVSSAPSEELSAFVNSINAARKAEYARIATKNGQTVAVVEKLAAEKLMGRVPAGQYIHNGSTWVKK